MPPLRWGSGVYFAGDKLSMLKQRRIRTEAKDGAYVIALSHRDWERWMKASPTLKHSLPSAEGHHGGHHTPGDLDFGGRERGRSR